MTSLPVLAVLVESAKLLALPSRLLPRASRRWSTIGPDFGVEVASRLALDIRLEYTGMALAGVERTQTVLRASARPRRSR